MRRITTVVTVLVLWLAVAWAPADAASLPGRAYVVQPGDTLSGIALREYGDAQAWRLIQDATNAKAAADTGFAAIADPAWLMPGQQLWLADPGLRAVELRGQALADRYRASIDDAIVVEPGEVVSTLIPVVDGNPRLTWDGPASQRRVLMVAWTGFGGYRDSVGRAFGLGGHDLWVTTAGEVRDFCGAFAAYNPSADLTLRLEQRLGLPASGRGPSSRYFVELWVNPADLFRPTPDPEITDATAELDYPPLAPAEHRRWFQAWRDEAYTVAPGFPWTRLGYTYDWGSPTSVVGFSEYVVRGDATVFPATAYATEDYCR